MERDIERKLGQELRRLGCLWYKWVSPGTVGVPDRILVRPDGSVSFVELKARYGTLSVQQRVRIREMREHGLDVRVVRGEEGARELLRETAEKYGTKDL